MKIAYLQSKPERSCMLFNSSASRRVELYVHSNLDAESYTLICLAGANEQFERQRCMGPFASSDLAKGAMNALISSLQNEGFELIRGVSIWELAAADLARKVRTERDKHPVDTGFVPLGIVPERP